MDFAEQTFGPGDPLHNAVLRFYQEEARMLDERRFDEWLDCLHEDMVYVLPVRSTVSWKDEQPFGDARSGYYDDNKATLALRLENVRKATAWGDDPPGRMRRFFSSLDVTRVSREEIRTRVNLLLTSLRNSEPQPEIIVAERRDTLYVEGDGFKIRRREVLLDNGGVPGRPLMVPI